MAKKMAPKANHPQSITIADVAKKASVSRAAASHVLLGSGAGKIRVGKDTANRIRKAATDLDYVPNQVARQLAGASSKLLGVLVDSKANDLNHTRLMLIESEARQMGYNLLISYEQPDKQAIDSLARNFLMRGVAGILCIHHVYPNDSDTVVESLLNVTNKAIFIDEPTISNAEWVGVDYQTGVEMLVDRLIKNGRRRIALVLPDTQWYQPPKMLHGYKAALKRHGMKVFKKLQYIHSERVPYTRDNYYDDFNEQAADNALHALTQEASADAIICFDDWFASSLISSAKKAGITIPSELAITGFGNYRIRQHVTPTITSVDFQLNLLAKQAVLRLINLIENKELPSTPNLITPLIIEGSSD
ncbi:Catabolite control protein A [Poriferisphaera corsica]|uniref:Catabolite control protein A n=1 Tax=Poriferisphaera corsica TaxID=2528020 RepID=A0A517YST1_9BACT|nr:LacI family DNA-binding transcriptional regulator [Poriferisphaera corsica]QDU33268.1 Catabolite control protein A [Poriferisphaera corsica]